MVGQGTQQHEAVKIMNNDVRVVTNVAVTSKDSTTNNVRTLGIWVENRLLQLKTIIKKSTIFPLDQKLPK